jgi:anion-transporting  ArsA/GET3 family ATPase
MASAPSTRNGPGRPAIGSASARTVLDRRLVVVTGKGGVGKTTIAAALALVAAERRLSTIVVELGDQHRLPDLFATAADAAAAESAQAGKKTAARRRSDRTRQSEEKRSGRENDAGAERVLAANLWSVTIDPDKATLEWLQALGGRVPGRVLASSGAFQYFAAAAPGGRELVSMIKVWELTRKERWRKRARSYDLVILDAPATGHALGLLHAPYTFGTIARVGPIFGQAEQVRELLLDPAQTAYLAVTHPTEMSIGETLDLRDGLRSQLGRELDATIVNAALPRRFGSDELERLARRCEQGPGKNGGAPGGDGPAGDDARAVLRSAQAAARSAHERARVQHNQIARLRRTGLSVHTVPFLFSAQIDLDAIATVGRRLATWV